MGKVLEWDGWLRRAVRDAARPLRGEPSDWDALLELVGDARIVLLGEATHGTAEFYRARAEITRRLIEEKGFNAVAVEADWPDARCIHRYVNGDLPGARPLDGLASFERFPKWMWRNTEVLAFIEWLAQHNRTTGAGAGFYGLDLYSLRSSMAAVIEYLDRVDPESATRARQRYACFDHFLGDLQTYGYSAGLGLIEPCEKAALAQLIELQRRAAELIGKGGEEAEEELFYVEQNARLVKDSEAYYRSMFQGGVASWNLRDTHMADTLDALLAHLDRRREHSKIVVWAHNSHIGDARATELSEGGELNLGQLVRERHDDMAVLVGFSTYRGTVAAARNWDEPAQRKRVRHALPGSYESLFHEAGMKRFFLPIRGSGEVRVALGASRLERAIGVVYRPETERSSHYFLARIAEQFDAIIHYDETSAVEPLDRDGGWEAEGELPETYPAGL